MENKKSRNNVEKPQNLYRSVDNSNFKQKIRNFIVKETTNRLPEVPISQPQSPSETMKGNNKNLAIVIPKKVIKMKIKQINKGKQELRTLKAIN